MVQATPRQCPRCNTPFAENQRICAWCGFNLDASLSGLNAPQKPYSGQPATQQPQPPQVSQHPLPPASQQVSQHPLPPASPQVSQHPLPPASRQVSLHPAPFSLPQVSQHPLPPASLQISQHPLPPASLQISQHPLPPPIQQPSQHPETQLSDEVPTQALPAENPASSPQPAQQPQILQHPETQQVDEMPTQAQPTVKPASSPQWGKPQISQHPETQQVDEVPTQAQPTVNPTPSPQPGQQQASLHPETMQQAGPPASLPQRGQQASMHPETMQPGRPPSLPQWGQQASLHPETMQSAGKPASSPQLGQQPSLHPETMQPAEQSSPPAKARSKKPMLIALILLVLVVLGGVGYVGYTSFAHRTPIQTPITTTTIHSTAISYAGVDVTILSVQSSQTFLDDPNVTSDSADQISTAMVRLNLQAQNTMTAPVNMLYDKIARLVLPGGKIVNPIYVKAVQTIAPGATQQAKIDFVVPVTSKTDQLVLRLGASNEAQLNIPLTTNADMSMYGPKTEQMSGQVVYQGLNWSLVNATTQLSVEGQQASSGMQFVTVTLKVNNTLSQPAITGSPFDYLRLKAGNVTVSPMDSTLPLMFSQGATGKTGTVTFMVPQNATSLTLLFQQTGGFDAQTLTFQL